MSIQPLLAAHRALTHVPRPCASLQYKPRRAPQRSSNYKPLTQAELLAEAAKTEIENTKSLQVWMAGRKGPVPAAAGRCC